jgi:hypothetical protein
VESEASETMTQARIMKHKTTVARIGAVGVRWQDRMKSEKVDEKRET